MAKFKPKDVVIYIGERLKEPLGGKVGTVYGYGTTTPYVIYIEKAMHSVTDKEIRKPTLREIKSYRATRKP